MKRILICEDEDTIREFVVINLKRAGYDVVDGPEIEEDKYNFEMLNIPKGHPYLKDILQEMLKIHSMLKVMNYY